jgi:hypothetical protein
MMVASSSVAGKTDRLLALAQNLGEFVRQSVQQGTSFDDFERGTLAQILQMGSAAAELFLFAQGNGDLGETIRTDNGDILKRSDTPLARPLRSIFGEHCFYSFVYSQGPNRKIELRSIDARLNLPEGKASYLFEEFSQLFCVEKAFGVGAEQLLAVFQQSVSVNALEHINRTMGTQAELFLEQMPKPPAKTEGALLIITADGKGVPLVRAEAQQVPVFEEKLERPGNRRMATLGCVYTVDSYVRTPEQIVAALFREDKVKKPDDRPEPVGKHYRGCFAEPARPDQPAIPSAYGTFSWIVQEARARHQAGQPVIRLMDGQSSLWEAADICMAEWLAKLHKTKACLVVDILDIIHVSSYLWRAAKVLYGAKEHREAFVQDRMLRILQGDVRGVVTGMRRMASQRTLKGKDLKEMNTACNYLESNAERMRYDEYLRAGYPIASGVIEGACRHVIKDRMEQGGMRWTLRGAKAMLNVRSVCASSEWKTFHQWRQGEGTTRLHTHRALVANYQGFAA